MTSELTYRTCPSCGGDDARRIPAYSPDGWNVVECKSCGFAYLQNPPPYTALVEDFAWEKTHIERRETRRGPVSRAARAVRAALGLKGRRSTEMFTRLFGPGRVLDIGCGGGEWLGPPMIPYGIEVSRVLCAAADTRMKAAGGYCLHGAGAERIRDFEDNFFDGVLMNSYLEHEVAMREILRATHRVLKPGGKAYVRVPNYGSLNRKLFGGKWCGFRWPDHVNYFTYPALRRIAGEIGLDTRRVNLLPLLFDDNVQALLIKE